MLRFSDQVGRRRLECRFNPVPRESRLSKSEFEKKNVKNFVTLEWSRSSFRVECVGRRKKRSGLSLFGPSDETTSNGRIKHARQGIRRKEADFRFACGFRGAGECAQSLSLSSSTEKRRALYCRRKGRARKRNGAITVALGQVHARSAPQ